MKHTGWRKPTPGLGVAEQHAQAGERVGVPKTKAFVAVKRVGAHIGLKPGDMLLLDTLAAFTQTQDWEEGRRPIVWASNAYLMEQTGFSLSALKRHARRLAEIGVICFKDSPNGKRWGRRNADGIIVEAYGFDLSPLSARVEEFEQLQAELRAERELCQQLKRRITIARRMIRTRIETAVTGALSGPWAQLNQLFEGLLAQLPKRKIASDHLAKILHRFTDLQAQVEAAYLGATTVIEAEENTERTLGTTSGQLSKNPQEMAPKRVISGPHIQTTNQPKSVIGNRLENINHASIDVYTIPEKQAASEECVSLGQTQKTPKAMDLATILQACPEFASWARNIGGFLRDWTDYNRVASQLAPMIGVSERVWNLAKDRLGPQLATTAFALVFEKHNAGEVTSPSGYLRGIVRKAGVGELHLERSFYGRLNRKAA
ncbi:plasmid replication protein RepC [Marinovum sp. 2_MG-2023]|uniref:plasmid replication protein RepC n=1 Tax=unclassified Marinovum TaxID=2647166 RepID=UPI0026E2DDFA|nr:MULTISPECIES: plasmid replication protein RepC [unclassified Marinovum]MDO6732054.1 plasmid replication protein RepC [Marinovum sp. 2_MG-2023]MDO6781369.1 plasmid replication protein RepC [Marinovum sp. 1_MG-2023]